MFTNYITGELNKGGVKIRRTPWNDEELSGETALIKDKLAKVNKRSIKNFDIMTKPSNRSGVV